ncbi:MAG: TlpA disulfide reductase family protein [Bacteroidota bacterium]
MDNTFPTLAPGKWRAVLQIEPKISIDNKKAEPLPELMDLEMEEVTEGELPFNFEVIYEDDNQFYIEIINGKERIRLKDVQTGHDIRTGKDSFLIHMPVYEAFIRGHFEERVMAGDFVVTNRSAPYSIPFIARHGHAHRFTTLKKTPVMDVSGKWEATFGLNEDAPYPAIGEFKQEGNYLTGTFLTETGDYRFLEGTIQENKLYLSCFDGAHAFLFEGKILEDQSMIGSFRSGKHYRTTWEAKKNPDVQLKNPNELTYLLEGYDKISFAFENPEGKVIALDDPAYQDKVKIIQIFGTWCPNCRDETNFLIDYLERNNNPDLAVVALAFEKHRDAGKAKKAIQTYRDHFNIPYEMLHAGYYNKKEAAKALPMLNHILSYPTMIFIDRKDQVRKIHTGFNGPATSKYESFKTEFESFVQQLLKE